MNQNHCIVCGTHIPAPLFVSEGAASLTTMLDILPSPTIVRYCENCGHLQTEPLKDLETYYSQHYQILAGSEDEDQLVSLKDGRNVLRNEHQTDMLLEKVSLPHGALVLDYGCAKSAVLRILTSRRADISAHVYDVSDLYIPFWKKFIPEGQWATHQVPPHWEGRFDLLTSFFALEHVAAPALFIKEVARLLKPDGVFYCIVPNVYDNLADFVVADHVSHFSASSIAYLLESAGFQLEHIDDTAHTGAWIFVGRRKAALGKSAPLSKADEMTRVEAERMAEFWRAFGGRVRDFETVHAAQPAVIYGSGFYGSYIMSCLEHREQILCFLDKNPHRQGQQIQGVPVLAPEDVPQAARVVYTALNPRIARDAMNEVPALQGRKFEFFFL